MSSPKDPNTYDPMDQFLSSRLKNWSRLQKPPEQARRALLHNAAVADGGELGTSEPWQTTDQRETGSQHDDPLATYLSLSLVFANPRPVT